MRLLIEHVAQKVEILAQAEAIISLNERGSYQVYINHICNCSDIDPSWRGNM